MHESLKTIPVSSATNTEGYGSVWLLQVLLGIFRQVNQGSIKEDLIDP